MYSFIMTVLHLHVSCWFVLTEQEPNNWLDYQDEGSIHGIGDLQNHRGFRDV